MLNVISEELVTVILCGCDSHSYSCSYNVNVSEKLNSCIYEKHKE